MAEEAGIPILIATEVEVFTDHQLAGSRYAVTQFSNLYAVVFQSVTDAD